MENRYEVKIARYALERMQEIVQYISSVLQSPENARRWLSGIHKEVEPLSFIPARIAFTEEEPWRSQDT